VEIARAREVINDGAQILVGAFDFRPEHRHCP
jgi:hypothetical protein